MSLRAVCREAHKSILDDANTLVIFYRKGRDRSWDWYCLVEDDYDFVDIGSYEWDEGYDYFIDGEELRKLTDILNEDKNAVIFYYDYWVDCVFDKAKGWMNLVREYYEKDHDANTKLSYFYDACCIKLD